MQIQSFKAPQASLIQAGSTVNSSVQTYHSRPTAQPQFGFFKMKPMEILMAATFIGLEKSARLLNIVTFGKFGLKKGEKIKFTIL